MARISAVAGSGGRTQVGEYCSKGVATPCPPGLTSFASCMASVDECEPCPKGFWCSAGKRIACGEGTFNDATGADDQSYCTRCPDHSFTLLEAQSSVDACVCEDHYGGEGGKTAEECFLRCQGPYLPLSPIGCG